jgi:hypothetical protein
MILTGQQKSALKEAIVKAYREEELEVLLSERMDLSYQAIARGGDYETIVFNLIQNLENEGRLGEFIATIKNKKPNSPYLKDLTQQGFPSQNINNYAPNAQGSTIINAQNVTGNTFIGTQNNYETGQVSTPMSHVDANALSTWRRKLSYLQNEEAIASDPSVKFQLQEQIRECQDKIKELGG